MGKRGLPLTTLTVYQLRLLAFLSVATFFEGYDYLALAQILPNLRSEMGISKGQGGDLVGIITLGTMLSYLLVRKADRWGRRRVLTLTIAGYTTFSLLTGFSPNAWVFAGFQLCARAFLIGEWAVTMIYAAEEYPADRRGMVIGLIQGFSTLGAITCALLVPRLLQTGLGWRAVYFVGGVPLIIIAIARRSLRETRRFLEQVQPAAPQPLLRILRSPYRGRVLQMAIIWALTYACTNSAITFWKEFVVGERGFTDNDVAQSMSLAAGVSMPLVFLSGKLFDLLGRRRGAGVIFGVTVIGVVGAYSLTAHAALTGALILGMFGTSAVLPLLNAYTAELFPTPLRSDAFAWANNLLGRVGAVLSPVVVGHVAAHLGWGRAVSITAVGPLLALVLIWVWLPETRGLELEESSALR